MTLTVPDWTRELSAPGWANIHDIVEQPQRLTAVDSFLGDPKAHTLILGKDCAPASEFRKRVKRGDLDPYRHNPRLPTNKTLSKVLCDLGIAAALDGSNANACGIYYANAYWLLRDDDQFSGALKNKDKAGEQSARVLTYLLEVLPLVRIIAMGKDAYDVLMQYFDLEHSWRENLEQRRAVSVSRIQIHASVHLGHFGVGNRVPRASRNECMDAIQMDWAHAFEG